jgi:hypothetical protein
MNPHVKSPQAVPPTDAELTLFARLRHACLG